MSCLVTRAPGIGVEPGSPLRNRQEAWQHELQGTQGWVCTITMRPSPSTNLSSHRVEPPQVLKCLWRVSLLTPHGCNREKMSGFRRTRSQGRRPESLPIPHLAWRWWLPPPSQSPQCGLGASPSIGSTSSRTGAQEGTNCSQGVSNSGNSSHAGEPDRVSPAAPSGHSQKQQGVAGRFWNFILKHLCCRLPSKKCQNKVSPM